MTAERETDPAQRQRPNDAVAIDRPRPSPLYRVLSAWLERCETWLRSHGGSRLRRGVWIFWGFVAAVGLFLLFGPVLNEPLSFDDITSSAGEATDTWVARSFAADYTLARDEAGRLTVQVEERITAFFPDDVDESAVERVIATQYEAHDLRPVIGEATIDGRAVDPVVRHGATRTTIEVRGEGRLRGDHEVVLRYELADVAYEDEDLSSGQSYQTLRWDVFGPEWSHAVMSSAMSIRVPAELAEQYARQPTGGLSWLLLAESATLEPDGEAQDDTGLVVYSLTNDQNIPPYASFWFTFRFAPGTFEMPPPSAVFWVQAVGPFVPLLLLGAAVVLAFAARAVAWADARGRAWFVSESGPRHDTTVALDARLWRARRTSALVEAIDLWSQDRTDPAIERRLVRTARRTGRIGDVVSALSRYRWASAWSEQFTRGLRRIPRGFVREGFLGAALGLTVLQWGLVRQLSHQLPVSAYWWPGAIVLLSTALAAIVFAVALSARPLTSEGALAVEHLRGQELYLSQTLASERTSLRDAQLPYIVMFARPRRAGRLVRELLAAEGIDRRVAADPDFVTTGRFAVRATAFVLIVAACALAFTTTAASRHALTQYDVLDDVEGDYGLYVADADIEATLSRGPDGEGRLEVVERFEATVDSNLRAVPQVTRAWRDTVDGHDQRLRVESITIDGEDAPFEQERMRGHAVVQTRVPDDWPGEHEIEVRYRLESPVAAVQAAGDWRDRVTWTALLPWWSSTWSGVDHETERLRVAMRLSPELAEQLASGSGWLDELESRPERPPVGFDPPSRAPGSDDLVFAFDESVEDEYKPGSHWPRSTGFAGVQLTFPEGTFSGVPRDDWIRHTAWTALPWVLAPSLALVTAVLSGLGIALGRDRLRRRGVLHDLVRFLAPALALAQLPLLGWASYDLSSDDPLALVLFTSVGVAVVMASWMLIVTRKRSPQHPTFTPTRKKKHPSARRSR